MQDPFTGQFTCLRGTYLPSSRERETILGDHRDRLWAFDNLVEKAGQCSIYADKDRDFAVLPEDEVSLLETSGGLWAELGRAIRGFRKSLPLIQLDTFGFETAGEDIFEANTSRVIRIGGGVEALAFQSSDASIYKFFFFRENGSIGASFTFTKRDEGVIFASAIPASYRLLLAKLSIINQIGAPTEIVGITPEGVLVVKQVLGEALPQGSDTSKLLPPGLIEIPSRFLQADRDHPRLLFINGEPWLVADLHARNFVRCADGQLRVIDLVAAPWPMDITAKETLVADWLERVRCDPTASVLRGSRDDEL